MTGHLGQPPGAGSGRARYARAMALYQAGRIDAAQLEGYRVAASEDDRGPAALFAERGLALPPEAEPEPEALVRRLVEEADRYLATLSGPGVAEVRQGIARGRAGAFSASVASHPVVAEHLAPALATLAPTHPALASAIAGAAPHLLWQGYDGYPVDSIGADFAAGHAYASVMGEAATIAATGFDLGLFVIAPHLLYRDHRHPAAELYAPLTGPHGWRFGPGRALSLRPAHRPVWNTALRPHLTKVGPLPFLCLFAWTSDVNAPAEVVPAEDWPELEALRLG